jgi:hypothetical protein
MRYFLIIFEKQSIYLFFLKNLLNYNINCYNSINFFLINIHNIKILNNNKI